MDDTTVLDGELPTGGLVRRLWKDRRTRVVAAGAVVALVVASGWLLWRGDRSPALPGTPGNARSPAQVGLGFLTALADGRSADASAYLDADPGATVFTSDAVLEESARLNPITDITVLDTEQQDDHGTVTVRYQFGDQRVIDTYDVVRPGKYWKLEGVGDGQVPGYIDVDWSPEAVRDHLTVNGVAVDPDEPIRLFPGTYRIGTTNPMLTVDDVLVVPALSTDGASTVGGPAYAPYRPSLALTDAGRQQVVQAVQSAIDTCLQEARLATSCGLSFSPHYYENRGGSPIESSLRWTVAPGSIDIASTDPVILAEARTDPTNDNLVPGLWAYWGRGDFGTVTAAGSLELTTGDTETYDDVLYYYAVDVSDPDHLVVFLFWLSSGLDARRGST